MHVKGKTIAFAGLTLAISVVLMALSGILEFNTLFLLGAASFFVGIMIREFGLRAGTAYYGAAVLLGLILTPNKLYCITFSAMGLYILLVEWTHRRLGRAESAQHRRKIFWTAKYVIFNVLYVPMLFFFPGLIFAGKSNVKLLIIALLAGQVVLFIYDRAYEYFQAHIWGKFRSKVL